MRWKRVRRPLSPIPVLILCLGFSGCYYSVPITASPTSKIDERLLGKWYRDDGVVTLIDRTDDYNYAIRLGTDSQTLPAFQSEVSGRRFVNFKVGQKYTYLIYKLEEHGNVLKIQAVSTKIIPESVKSSTEVQRLIAQNLYNPKLFEELDFYAREAPIRKSQLVNALRQLHRGDSQADIVNQIRIRGVDFQLTPTIQTELEDAGARPELIDTTRKNFRGKKKT